MKHDEILFDLFIMEFWMSHYDGFIGKRFTVGDIKSELFFNSMRLTPNYLAVKSCFPENEYFRTIMTFNYKLYEYEDTYKGNFIGEV